MTDTQIIITSIAFLFFIFITSVISSCFYTVDQGYISIIERFGRFHSVGQPGLNFKIPLVDKVVGNLRSTVWPISVIIETKTLDNVFVNIKINTQCKNISGKEFEAYYMISIESLKSYISDSIRAIAPLYTLDKLFQQKDDLAQELKKDLAPIFEQYGYNILSTLIVDLEPDARVKHAMNEINEAQRLRVAATEKAEAEKILVVKAAEAQAESRILQGKGVAGQRKAIIEGLRESLDELKNHKSENPITEQDAITLLLLNQYFDTLKDIGAHAKTNAIFLNHNPSGLNQITEQLKNSIIEATVAAETVK